MMKNSKGTISIFLALIILPIYSLSILTMDIVKVLVSKNHLNIANEIASYSIESSFNDKLYEKYGIFGIDKDIDQLDQYVNYVLKENVENQESKYYQASIKDSNLLVKDEDLLLSGENLEKQIIEYMKLMGPYRIANGVINLINITKSSKKYTNILNNKLDYEEEYSKSVNNINTLLDNFILYDNNYEKINKAIFSLNKRLKDIKTKIRKNTSKFVSLKFKDIKKLKSEDIKTKSENILNEKNINIIFEIEKLTNKKLKNTENIDFVKAVKEYKNLLEEIYPLSKKWKVNDKFLIEDKSIDVSVYLEKIIKYYLSIISENNKIIEKDLAEYNITNQNLITDMRIMDNILKSLVLQLEKASENTIILQGKLEKWGDSIKSIEQNDIRNNFDAEYKSTKLMFTKENVDTFLKKIREHKDTFPSIFKEIENKKDIFKIDIANFSSIKVISFDFQKQVRLPSLKKYKIYKFAVESKDKKIDNNKKKEAKSNKKNIEKFGSENKDNSIDKSNNSIYDFVNKEIFEELSNISKEDNYSISNKNNIANYKNIFNLSSKLIDSSDDNFIESLYLAQYIADKFNNKLIDKDSFDSQIEYILFGKEKLSDNNNNVNNIIFAIRFLLNSIYAYTNSDLKLQANAIAIAIAGWTGFAVPLIRSLVLSAMSFGETALDLEKLNSNKYVEAFKNKYSWQVSVTSIPSLLDKEGKDIASSAIDNIYDSIINYTNQGIEFLKNNVDEFANQTIDGVSQSIISEIVSPIQNILLNKINKEISDTKKETENLFTQIKSNIESDKDDLYDVKLNIFNYVKDNISKDINKINEINIEEYFKNMTLTIENKIKSLTEKHSISLKNKVNSSLSNNKIKQKELISKHIDDYLKDIGMDKKIHNLGSSSGLSFKYKDYLTLVILFKIISGNKSEILKRAAIVMDYEMKKEYSNFDISKVFVSFKIDSKLMINTKILNKYLFKDIVQEKIIGGY